ncbi:hypothetical protein SK128_011138 [Halocaridina rubra]|uniref:Secreted protein n=1 Tax=Halocaridina rubra TaxID=373956 RepID=A0AAN9A4Z4_HALRR
MRGVISHKTLTTLWCIAQLLQPRADMCNKEKSNASKELQTQHDLFPYLVAKAYCMGPTSHEFFAQFIASITI